MSASPSVRPVSGIIEDVTDILSDSPNQEPSLPADATTSTATTPVNVQNQRGGANKGPEEKEQEQESTTQSHPLVDNNQPRISLKDEKSSRTDAFRSASLCSPQENDQELEGGPLGLKGRHRQTPSGVSNISVTSSSSSPQSAGVFLTALTGGELRAGGGGEEEEEEEEEERGDGLVGMATGEFVSNKAHSRTVSGISNVSSVRSMASSLGGNDSGIMHGSLSFAKRKLSTVSSDGSAGGFNGASQTNVSAGVEVVDGAGAVVYPKAPITCKLKCDPDAVQVDGSCEYILKVRTTLTRFHKRHFQVKRTQKDFKNLYIYLKNRSAISPCPTSSLSSTASSILRKFSASSASSVDAKSDSGEEQPSSHLEGVLIPPFPEFKQQSTGRGLFSSSSTRTSSASTSTSNIVKEKAATGKQDPTSESKQSLNQSELCMSPSATGMANMEDGAGGKSAAEEAMSTSESSLVNTARQSSADNGLSEASINDLQDLYEDEQYLYKPMGNQTQAQFEYEKKLNRFLQRLLTRASVLEDKVFCEFLEDENYSGPPVEETSYSYFGGLFGRSSDTVKSGCGGFLSGWGKYKASALMDSDAEIVRKTNEINSLKTKVKDFLAKGKTIMREYNGLADLITSFAGTLIVTGMGINDSEAKMSFTGFGNEYQFVAANVKLDTVIVESILTDLFKQWLTDIENIEELFSERLQFVAQVNALQKDYDKKLKYTERRNDEASQRDLSEAETKLSVATSKLAAVSSRVKKEVDHFKVDLFTSCCDTLRALGHCRAYHAKEQLGTWKHLLQTLSSRQT